MMDVALLRKAVEWAEAEAARPDQENSEWWQKGWVASGVEIDRSCGTAYCIAGYVVHQAGETPSRTGFATGYRAAELLGIPLKEVIGSFQANGLFAADNTIKQVRAFAEHLVEKYGEEGEKL